MGAPTVYRWDDDNAPVLDCDATNAASSLIEVFRACLVDGYGTKTPPGFGYELRYIEADNSAMALKSLNPESNGFWFQVATADAYNNTTGGAINIGYIDMYEHMQSAIDGKVGEVSGEGNIYTSNSISYVNDPIPWVLIADDRFFYFFVFSGSQSHGVSQSPTIASLYSSSVVCAGDFVSLIDDPWSSLVYGNTVSLLYGGRFGLMTGLANAASATLSAYFLRSVNGTPDRISAVIGPTDPLYRISNTSSYFGATYTNNTNLDFSDGAPIVVAKPLLIEAADAIQPRGYLPGLYYPVHNAPYDCFEEVTIDDKNFLAVNVKIYNGVNGQVLISLDDWRA